MAVLRVSLGGNNYETLTWGRSILSESFKKKNSEFKTICSPVEDDILQVRKGSFVLAQWSGLRWTPREKIIHWPSYLFNSTLQFINISLRIILEEIRILYVVVIAFPIIDGSWLPNRFFELVRHLSIFIISLFFSSRYKLYSFQLLPLMNIHKCCDFSYL